MTLTDQRGSLVIIRQIPLVLLLVAALFSLPFLAYSLYLIARGIDADGKWFCLFLGLFMAWLLLEFVATRERFDINLSEHSLSRRVSGVFRRPRQLIDLKKVTKIDVELKKDQRGRRFQYLYLYGDDEQYLVNSPAKKYMDHRKTARLLSEVTGIPYPQ
jgi:hypothetical protein